MDSQIEQLPDLTGYLKFASVAHWQQVTLAAPESTADSAQARDEAITVWQRWRANHAPAAVRGTRENARDLTSPHSHYRE